MTEAARADVLAFLQSALLKSRRKLASAGTQEGVAAPFDLPKAGMPGNTHIMMGTASQTGWESRDRCG